ncbi:MAG TPA: hypothetical protein VF816_10675 [Rhodocyclaceae bacterium]
MKTPFAPIVLAAALGLSLGACSSIRVWPFGDDKPQAGPRIPANAVAYQCANGTRFYVRKLEDDSAIWLILPDREVRLSKASEGHYSNAATVLDLSAGEASLADGPANLRGCKAG